MKKPDDDRGKLTVPDVATQREVMRFWRMAVEMERRAKEDDHRRGGSRPASGR